MIPLAKPTVVTKSPDTDNIDVWMCCWFMGIMPPGGDSSYIKQQDYTVSLFADLEPTRGAGAAVNGNAKVLRDKPLTLNHASVNQFVPQPLCWLNADRIDLDDEHLLNLTRIATYTHSSFLSIRNTGELHVHAWYADRGGAPLDGVYLQIVNTGVYRGPNPQLVRDNQHETWHQTDQQEITHTGYIPYMFMGTPGGDERDSDWWLPGHATDRVVHNTVFMPSRIYLLEKSTMHGWD